MIARLINRADGRAVFAAHELPDVVQGAVLGEMVRPRVRSSSMAPALLKGDRLLLAPAGTVQAGDVLVFRRGVLLLCHRVHRVEGDVLVMKGDAVAGSEERIASSDVVGRVRAVIRGSIAISVSHRGPTSKTVSRRCFHKGSPTFLLERLRSFVGRLCAGVVTVSGVSAAATWLVLRLARADMYERARLSSFYADVWVQTVKLTDLGRLRETPMTRSKDLSRIRFGIRMGRLYLGTCTVAPWSLRLRPALSMLERAITLQVCRAGLDAPPTKGEVSRL